MSQKGLTGGWSKYGGAKQQVVKESIDREWICQSCQARHAAEMTPYLYQFMDDEYIRVCAICISDDCAALRKRRDAY